jgi:hypothetical protein
LAAALPDHAIRGTTRSPERLAELETAGIEGVVANPDRLATLVGALSGVTVVCWLMGSATGSPDVHGGRLETLMGHLVDTPVRGFVYEAAGSVEPEVLAEGAAIVGCAYDRWRIPTTIVRTPPSEHAGWLADTTEAVERLLR